MTLFLASVASAHEAATALAEGADIIDAKDPAHGGFAALPLARVAEIVATVGGRASTSAVAGSPTTPDGTREMLPPWRRPDWSSSRLG